MFLQRRDLQSCEFTVGVLQAHSEGYCNAASFFSISSNGVYKSLKLYSYFTLVAQSQIKNLLNKSNCNPFFYHQSDHCVWWKNKSRLLSSLVAKRKRPLHHVIFIT